MKKPLIFLIVLVISAVAVFLSRQPIQAAVMRVVNSVRVTNSLVGYWSFDGPTINWATGQVTDLSVSGNTGQLIGMSTTTSPIEGMVGQGLKFDGVASFVDLGAPASLNITTDNNTLSAWVYPKSLNGTYYYNIVISGRRTEVNQPYDMVISPTVIGTQINTTAGWKILTSATTIPLNQWSYITISRASTTVKFYKDGAFLSQSTFTGVVNGGDGILIGKGFFGGPYFFNGLIDEVRIYNRTLSDGEIQYLYRKNAKEFGTKINVSKKDKFTSGLVGYWSFDGPTINWATGQVTDLSVSGNTGQLLNMSTTTSPIEGIVGQALKFDGVNDKFHVSDNDVLDIAAAANFSVAMWVYPYSNQQGYIIEKRQVGGSYLPFYSVWFLNGVTEFEIYSDVGWNPYGGTLNTPLNTWSFITYKKINNTVYSYLNGAFVESVADAKYAGEVSNNGKFSIGYRAAFNDQYFNGATDEVRVYSRALSDAEIMDMYEASASTYRSQVNAPQTTKFTNGLAGYWSFDGPTINWATGKVTDLSGNSYTGQLLNMSTTTSPTEGIVGQGLKFDGSNDFIWGTTNAVFDASSTPITVLAWVKPSSSAAFAVIVSKGEISGGWGVAYNTNQTMYVGFKNSANQNTVARSSNSTFPINTWTHVAAIIIMDSVTSGNNDIQLYINGKSDQGSLTPGLPTPYLAAPLRIGARGSSAAGSEASYFNGIIDEVRIYNRALSNAEIEQIYKSGRR